MIDKDAGLATLLFTACDNYKIRFLRTQAVLMEIDRFITLIIAMSLMSDCFVIFLLSAH